MQHPSQGDARGSARPAPRDALRQRSRGAGRVGNHPRAARASPPHLPSTTPSGASVVRVSGFQGSGFTRVHLHVCQVAQAVQQLLLQLSHLLLQLLLLGRGLRLALRPGRSGGGSCHGGCEGGRHGGWRAARGWGRWVGRRAWRGKGGGWLSKTADELHERRFASTPHRRRQVPHPLLRPMPPLGAHGALGMHKHIHACSSVHSHPRARRQNQ